MAQLQDVQIASPAFKANPHPFYDRLRASSPVCRVMLPSKQEAWLVARYDDVATLLKDPRFAKDRQNALTEKQLARQPWTPSVFAPLMRNMLDRDDPDHARLRKLVHKAFTVRRVEMITERTQALSDELLDKIRRRHTFDLIDDFALPLPVTIISELLGVPEGDRTNFARWSKTMIKNTMSPLSVLLSLPSMLSFIKYIRGLVKQKRLAPQDDLVSALVQAEEAGEQLTEDELLAMIVLLLTAGHETTVNLIGNGMLALLQNPEQLDRLRKNPELIETAVEELLRFSSPVEMSTYRYAREELTIADSTIPRGSLVLGVIASANRDERQFHEAQTLDVARSPNKHLTFGQGGHYCVGAPLARMEGRIAINALLRRLPAIRLGRPVEQLKWRRGLVLRGLVSLPLAI